jgi:predicted ABC-type transport system involved in lysophospholipase L1 biosynthesis ATPase subunit
MKIIQMNVDNFMRLSAVEIRPDGKVVTITGKNGSGKSSLLNAIFCAVAGKDVHPDKPIRAGQHSAVITLDLGDVTVTRRFTPSGTTVTVESKEGAVFRSPQAMLDGMIGRLSFDPIAFARLKPAEQLEQLRSIVTVDVDLDALDETIRAAYAERTERNRLVKSLAARVAVLAGECHPELDTTPDDESGMVDQLARAAEHNAAVQARRSERVVVERAIAERVDEIARIKAEMVKLAARLVDVEADLVAREGRLAAADAIPEPIDTAVLRIAITDARTANAAKADEERRRATWQAVIDEQQVAFSESENLTAAIEDATATKRDAIARATMPVPGLGFGDGHITYQDVPFSQASSAEQIRVATAIGMALNPKLRILGIRDGSLLDEASLAIVADLAEQHDFQVWVERVSTDASVGIHMVDGSVASIDGEPVELDGHVVAVA